MAPAPQLTDRRRFSRVPCDFPVRVEKVPKRSLADIENLLSEDLSEGGIRLSSPRFFPVQERMLLELDAPEEPGSIRALGRVVWVEQSSYTDQFRLGVEFADLSERDRSRLRGLVEQQQVGA
jgi:c-di-GMP-binding flagellar brake protein YcgR